MNSSEGVHDSKEHAELETGVGTVEENVKLHASPDDDFDMYQGKVRRVSWPSAYVPYYGDDPADGDPLEALEREYPELDGPDVLDTSSGPVEDACGGLKRDHDKGPAKKVRFTRGCPSCESGMHVPGIRHAKVCRQRFQDAGKRDDIEKVPDPTGADRSEELDLSEVKVGEELPIEQLERDMGHDQRRGPPKLSAVVGGDLDHDQVPVGLWDVHIHAFLATNSDELVRDLPVYSIRYADNATSVVIRWGAHKVKLWVPECSVDDSTLKELSGESTRAGMKIEIQNLLDLQTGDLYTWDELQAKGLDKTCRIIASRWVTVDKGAGVTRARLVIKRCCQEF